MSQASLPPSPGLAALRPFLPVLLLLFFGSGCAALIYEIVWFQLLQLVIGSSAVSLGVLLATFMGGMCLGSLALPSLLAPHRHPLRVYAALELAIGVLGIVLLFAMPAIDRLYASAGGHGFLAVLARGLVCAVCLLPPTILMGATLPAVARWIQTTPEGVSWLGFFYGGNIAGAVLGCLLAGFYLLRLHDLATATYVACAINLAVALVSLGLAQATPFVPSVAKDAAEPVRSWSGVWAVYVTIALSGAGALAAEVVWTRLLSLLLGATVYTFSIILAVFLVGLGLGSTVGSLVARTSSRPRVALGYCQLLLTAAMAWSAYMLAQSLPWWPVNPNLAASPWYVFQLDLARCLWAILPAACLWGASFPLALAAAAAPGQDPARLAGGVYAANTVGAIVGALGTSLFLIRGLGTQQGQRVLIGLAGAAAVLMLASQVGTSRRRVLGLAAVTALAALAAWTVPAVPWQVVAYGRGLPNAPAGGRVLFLGEGMSSSVVVTEYDSLDDLDPESEPWTRYFHVSGKVEASTNPQDMRLQRMLGHIPALVHPRPRSVLVVGCGAGVTAGTFAVHPDVERIVICEIEPLVPRVAGAWFAGANHHVLHDPRVEIVHDDARHFILTTRETFDVITSDPIHPWVKGSATLYTEEYFRLCRARLNPGGVISQWVPLYESSRDVVQSEMATFFSVFPHGTVWNNSQDGNGYDVVLLGQAEPTTIDVDKVQARLNQRDHAAAARSLHDVGFQGAISLFGTYAARASDLAPWLEGAPINRDRDLRLQYLAGMSINAGQTNLINDELTSCHTFPEGLFSGDGMHSAALRLALKRRVP